MTVTSREVVAFRLASQGVTERGTQPARALDGWAVQDSPPGAAAVAALARTDNLDPAWLDRALTEDRSVIALYNARTATSIVPAEDAAAFGTALLPDGDRALKALLGRAVPEQSAGLQEPVDLAVDAISDALDGRELSRDDLHEELRHRLPKALLPWCEGCQSHHARRGLLVLASLSGRLCISGRQGRQPCFSRTDQWIDWTPPTPKSARQDLVRRYVRWYGPTTPKQFADWAGLANSHARDLWASIDAELTEVEVDGARPAWILSDDAGLLDDPPELDGVRLIGPGDPLLLAKDREVLVPDPAARKKVWTAIPTTGIVLAGGDAIALWKARKAKSRLEITVTPIGAKVPVEKVKDSLAAEGEALAAVRGCEAAVVTMG